MTIEIFSLYQPSTSADRKRAEKSTHPQKYHCLRIWKKVLKKALQLTKKERKIIITTRTNTNMFREIGFHKNNNNNKCRYLQLLMVKDNFTDASIIFTWHFI